MRYHKPLFPVVQFFTAISLVMFASAAWAQDEVPAASDFSIIQMKVEDGQLVSSYTVQVPYVETVNQNYTVNVPVTEQVENEDGEIVNQTVMKQEVRTREIPVQRIRVETRERVLSPDEFRTVAGEQLTVEQVSAMDGSAFPVIVFDAGTELSEFHRSMFKPETLVIAGTAEPPAERAAAEEPANEQVADADAELDAQAILEAAGEQPGEQPGEPADFSFAVLSEQSETLIASYEANTTVVENVQQTYTVMVPYTEQVENENGDIVNVTKMRPEQRTRMMTVNKMQTGSQKTIVQPRQLQTLAGEPLSEEQIAGLADQPMTALLIHQGNPTELHRQVFKPETIVILLNH